MQLREFLGREGFNNGILYSQANLIAELRIGEQAVHAEKGGMVVEEKRGECVVHDVLHSARTPHIPPDAFQSRDDAVNHEVVLITGSLFKRIQAHRILKIGRVEVGEIVCSMRRDTVEKLFRHVPVRIDKTHSPPLMDVLKDQVAKEGGFACARLAD